MRKSPSEVHSKNAWQIFHFYFAIFFSFCLTFLSITLIRRAQKNGPIHERIVISVDFSKPALAGTTFTLEVTQLLTLLHRRYIWRLIMLYDALKLLSLSLSVRGYLKNCNNYLQEISIVVLYICIYRDAK